VSARMVKAQTMRKRKEEEEEDVFIINIFDDDDDTDADKKRSYDLMCRIYPVNRIARSPDVGASFFARACACVCMRLCRSSQIVGVIFFFFALENTEKK